MSEHASPTLAVVGAGRVGATLAYAALVRGAVRRVVLYDVDRRKVEAEALDIAHGIQFTPMAEVHGSDDIEVCRGADIVAVTAGAKQQPGQSRLDLAESTIGLMRQLMPALLEVAPDAVYLMVTNPVDVVTYAAHRLAEGSPARIVGSGTVLDSSRLRFLVAQHLGVAVQNVHAYMVGEHGDSEFPLWSSASVGGVPLVAYSEGLQPLEEADRDRIARSVINAAYAIIEGKGATNYAIGLAATRIIESLLRDEHRVLPVSTMLDDYWGISDVCLSVPTVVGRRVGPRLKVPMSDDELAQLHVSADKIRAVARSLGF